MRFQLQATYCKKGQNNNMTGHGLRTERNGNCLQGPINIDTLKNIQCNCRLKKT